MIPLSRFHHAPIATALRLVALAFWAWGSHAAAGTVVVESASTTVTNDASASLEFPATRTAGDDRYPVWVHYQSEDDTAIAGEDYSTVSGQLQLSAGSDTASISVPVSAADSYSDSKTLTLKLNDAISVGPSPQFGQPATFASGDLPTDVARADFNGDGKQDMVVANRTGGRLNVFLNRAAHDADSADFHATQDFNVGSPDAVAVADINTDGKADIIASNDDSDGLFVLLNTSTPGASSASFVSAGTFPVGPSAGDIATADLNGDGRPDVVVTNDGAVNNPDRSVAVLMNTTSAGAMSASFVAQQAFSVGDYPRGVVSADFNADQKPDLAVANARGDSVSVLLNTTSHGDSQAAFAAAYTAPVGRAPASLVAADLNSDGRPDLVTTDQWDDQISVLVNATPAGPASGAGAVAADFISDQVVATGEEPTSISAADLNGDGKPDLAIVNQADDTLTLLANTTIPGATTVGLNSPQTLDTLGSPIAVLLSPMNSDAHADLIVTQGQGGTVSVRINGLASADGLPNLVDAGQHYMLVIGDIKAADINGDGRPDVTTFGSGYFTSTLNRTAPGADNPAEKDLDNDALVYHESDENGYFSGTLADINGDGKLDVVSRNGGVYDGLNEAWSNDGAIEVRFNTTAPTDITPSFGEALVIPLNGLGPSVVSATDMNGDGKSDLVLAYRATNQIAVFLNTTSPQASMASFAAGQTFPTPLDAVDRLATADMNGDGKMDIMLSDRVGQAFGIRLNTTPSGSGTVSLGSSQTFSSPGYPLQFVVTDVNTDGRPDIVTSHDGADSINVRLNTTPAGASVASLHPRQAFAAGNSPMEIATGDLNGDGRPDIITQNFDSAMNVDYSTSVIINHTRPGSLNADYRLSESLDFGPETRPLTSAVADMNGDGANDLLTPVSSGLLNNNIVFHFNNTYAASVTPDSVTGTIHYAIPRLTLSPSALDFGAQPADSSTEQTLTLGNTGGGALSLSGLSATGDNASAFSASHECGSELTPGESCTVQVSYRPDAIGNQSASLAVSTDAPGSPESLPLTGTGTNTAPTAMAASLEVNAGQQTSAILQAVDSDDGQRLSLTIVTQPTHGSVTLTDPQTGAYTYRADAGYTGGDSFTFKASDGYQDSSPATVSVQVRSAPQDAGPRFNSSGNGGAVAGWGVLLLAGLVVRRGRKRP